MNAFSIPLIDGKVTGKSRLNFSTFVDLLDSNVRYSLALALLKVLGLKVHIDHEDVMEFQVTNPALKSNFHQWLHERQVHIAKKEEKDKSLFSSTLTKRQVVAEEV